MSVIEAVPQSEAEAMAAIAHANVITPNNAGFNYGRPIVQLARKSSFFLTVHRAG
jgi:hypothetical protein